MAVAGEKIRVQGAQVERDMAYAMGAVNAAEDAEILARTGEALKRNTAARHAGNGVKEGNSDPTTLCLLMLDDANELIDQPVVLYGIDEVDLRSAYGRCFSKVLNCLLASAIDCARVDNDISGLVLQTTQYRVDRCSGIGDQNYGVGWGFKETSKCCSRLVK